MEKEQNEQIALFRYGVISDLVGGVRLEHGDMERLIRKKARQPWHIPFSRRTSISASTIRRWVRLYENSGRNYLALSPQERSDKGHSRRVDEETVLGMVALKKENPTWTAPMLLDKMEELQIIPPGHSLSLSSIYRILKREGVNKRHSDKTDRRRYEAEFPNDLWQSDVMHGPRVRVDGKQRKTYLIAFLDDHSRLITHGEFYLSESIIPFLDALKQALLKRGLPRKLYVDNGAAFRSGHLSKVCASLGIAKYHAPPYTPQGKGKIERFFRTVRQQFLPKVYTDHLSGLNEAFDLWLNEVYHQRKHSSTQQAPFERFAKHVELLRKTPVDLEDHFRKAARRRVTKDRTISLECNLYEAPATLIGERVELLFSPDNLKKVEILFKGKSHGFLVPLDKHVNCTVSREKTTPSTAPEKSGELPF